ncbi:peroxiredoxin family protein [Shewanella nanhaiensis]|uniref:Redoxin family protein n=1 Tax=Shewanella nanhaiensis TaxID=2864872 RepID=A0ABS7DXP2_9GAMM|nr:redoxin domain-containing protein [Shewanella nanhaiensis]MBW8182193.1 redoxin family protein [Shewanella nanhaiensis]
MLKRVKQLNIKGLILIGMMTISGLLAVNAEPLAVERLAPDFSLSRIDGSQFNLSDFRGEKSVYLIFWNTWCGHCMKKVPKLVEIQSELGEQVELLAINTSWSDSLGEIEQFKARFNPNYAIAFDRDADITRRYGVIGTPTGFLIDINGMIKQVDGITHTLAANLDSWNTIKPARNDRTLGVTCQQHKQGSNKETAC